jgi:arginine N-succinyltransferase
MLVVRNALPSDLDAIVALAAGSGPGMTTLKPDRAQLARRLQIVAASFAGQAAAADADYLFVLEDLDQGRVCGVCAIKGAVGLDTPFYSYRLGTSVHANPSTGVVNRVEAIHLSHDLAGSAELCSLYLHPAYRHGANGRLLSKSRLLFIAQFPERFPDKIFAEMRGYQTIDAVSPFWESLGRHFFHMDFEEADDLCGKGERQFIEQLVPRLPLYTHLLGPEACAAIGKTHPETAPARRLLEQEGLLFDGFIDIFDAGPVLQARVRDIRAVRESRVHGVRLGALDGGRAALVATTCGQAFRVAACQVDIGDGGDGGDGGGAVIAPETAGALGLAPGGQARVYLSEQPPPLRV